jgi:chemotaxis protein MotB
MRRRLPRSRITHDRWLVSYADFITLLFAFFVMLFAFAKADEKKQQQVQQSIDSAFNSLGIFAAIPSRPSVSRPDHQLPEETTLPPAAVNGDDVLVPARVTEDLNRTRRILEQSLAPQIAAHTVSIHIGRDGLVISLREAGFFASGSAIPSPQTLPTVRQVAASIDKTPFDLRIEGHTDSVPMHSQEFDSNWELSTARATGVARLILSLNTLPPDRISAAGYAGFHPVASNETEEGRSQNRRVDLVLFPRLRLDDSNLQPVHAPGAWRRITDN